MNKTSQLNYSVISPHLVAGTNTSANEDNWSFGLHMALSKGALNILAIQVKGWHYLLQAVAVCIHSPCPWHVSNRGVAEIEARIP